jgi:hypothetical protein
VRLNPASGSAKNGYQEADQDDRANFVLQIIQMVELLPVLRTSCIAPLKDQANAIKIGCYGNQPCYQHCAESRAVWGRVEPKPGTRAENYEDCRDFYELIDANVQVSQGPMIAPIP